MRYRASAGGLFCLMVCGASVLACGDSPGDTAGGGGTSTGTAGSGGSGTTPSPCEPCPKGSHELPDCSCEATLVEWTAGPLLNSARDHHVTFAVETASGGYLYVAGGASAFGSAQTSVERAAIADDGTLSPFEQIEKLPVGLVGPGLAQSGSGVVIAGGLKNDGNSTAETFIGAIGDDGHITYTPGPPLTQDRYHVGVVEARGFVFALGGLQQAVVGGTPMQTVLDVVERATFDGTTLSDFVAIGTLPSTLTHHTVFSYLDSIYVLGGGSGAPATADILRATVSDTGDLGPWETVGTLPEERATASADVFLGQLYVFAGMQSLVGQERDTVLRAPIADEGTVGTFTEITPLPLARAHCHQTPKYGGFFYSAGGSIDHKPQKDVFIGKLE